MTGISALHESGTGGTPKVRVRAFAASDGVASKLPFSCLRLLHQQYGVVSQMPLVGDIQHLNLADNTSYAQTRVIVLNKAQCQDVHMS